MLFVCLNASGFSLISECSHGGFHKNTEESCRVTFKTLKNSQLISRCWQLRWWFGRASSLQTIYRQPMVPSGHRKFWYQILWSGYTGCLYKSGSLFGMDWIQHERMKSIIGGNHKLCRQDFAHYCPSTYPLVTFVKEFLYCYINCCITLTFLVPPTYLPRLDKVFKERPPNADASEPNGLKDSFC